MTLYLGCPVWANTDWKNLLYDNDLAPSDFLANYSRFFNSVEGNTTFYATPTTENIQKWLQQSQADFRFTLKLPRSISHLFDQWQPELLQQWLQLFLPLRNKIGLLHLQLPAHFSPAAMPWLQQMLGAVRPLYPLAVEVRHPAFFDKAEHEIRLNRLLRDWETERVIFDSRALFSVAPTTVQLAEAQRKKPYLPVHAIALSQTPMLRFVGVDDPDRNRLYYQPWLAKVRQWLHEGRSPYLFFHSPDNQTSPMLARQFVQELGINHPILQPWLAPPPQLNLL